MVTLIYVSDMQLLVRLNLPSKPGLVDGLGLWRRANGRSLLSNRWIGVVETCQRTFVAQQC